MDVFLDKHFLQGNEKTLNSFQLRLEQFGPRSLTDAELLSLMIGKDNTNLASDILSDYGNDLNLLSRTQTRDLLKFEGIGEAKALQLVAAFELSRRRWDYSQLGKPKITSSQVAYNYLIPFLKGKPQEEFWMLSLNNQLQVIRPVQIAMGGINNVAVDIKLIFHHLVKDLATGVFLAHNHPSGTKEFSKQDLDFTKQVKSVADIFQIKVIDHLVLTDTGYNSMSDLGLL